MELFDRKGKWNATLWIVVNGRRKRLYRSTGIAVEGKEGSRRYNESRNLARDRATELARQLQLEASGLGGQGSQKTTLQQALATSVQAGAAFERPVFDAVFSHFDPDMAAEDISSRALQHFCAELVREGHSADAIRLYATAVHDAIGHVVKEPPPMPLSSFMVSPAALLDDYFAMIKLRDSTLRDYRAVVTEFLDFCEVNEAATAGDITTEALMLFSSHLQMKPKRVAVKGGKSGAKQPTAALRSAVAINRELRSLAAVLNRLRRKQRLPHLRVGEISEALECLETVREVKPFLSHLQIRRLLEASNDMPCADFIRFMLLTGLRAQEGRALEWSEVDLPNQVLRLDPNKVKIKRGRVVDLAVSPSVIEMLQRRPRTGSYVFGGEKPVGDLRYHFDKLPFHGLQELRRTCDTYLFCMPAYGPGRAALRCGHSVTVAERHYVGMVRVPPSASTLEQAMGLE